MPPPELESSWRDARDRFGGLEAFVHSSDATTPTGDVAYRVALYSSWVLLTYATAQAALGGLGTACLAILGSVAPVPGQLPNVVLAQHRIRTLNHLAGLASSRQDTYFEESLSVLDQAGWHERSRLMHLDQNVWPDYVREWLTRVGVGSQQMAWMSEPREDASETLASRLARLVDERNGLAHGGLPDNILNATTMCQWIDDTRRFVERCVATLQSHIAELLGLSLTSIGEIDASVSLGNMTVAISEIAASVAVGDHLLLRSEDSLKSCIVTSMQSSGEALDSATAGTLEVAVSVDRRVRDGLLFVAI